MCDNGIYLSLIQFSDINKNCICVEDTDDLSLFSEPDFQGGGQFCCTTYFESWVATDVKFGIDTPIFGDFNVSVRFHLPYICCCVQKLKFINVDWENKAKSRTVLPPVKVRKK